MWERLSRERGCKSLRKETVECVQATQVDQ